MTQSHLGAFQEHCLGFPKRPYFPNSMKIATRSVSRRPSPSCQKSLLRSICFGILASKRSTARVCRLQAAPRPVSSPSFSHLCQPIPLSSPSFRHWILEPLDLGFLVLLIFSSSDLLLPCVDVTDRPGYDRIFPSPPFGPRHLPVHCRLVSCTCTLLVIYTDLAAPFSHISQSSLEASTICLP